jgi:hypothetical protein
MVINVLQMRREVALEARVWVSIARVDITQVIAGRPPIDVATASSSRRDT